VVQIHLPLPLINGEAVNAKLAKKLRRKAKQKTVGQPAVDYVTHETGAVLVSPTSTRGVYRRLKRQTRKA
jgi:hypothetical protein